MSKNKQECPTVHISHRGRGRGRGGLRGLKLFGQFPYGHISKRGFPYFIENGNYCNDNKPVPQTDLLAKRIPRNTSRWPLLCLWTGLLCLGVLLLSGVRGQTINKNHGMLTFKATFQVHAKTNSSFCITWWDGYNFIIFLNWLHLYYNSFSHFYYLALMYHCITTVSLFLMRLAYN